jgi:NTE family protein
VLKVLERLQVPVDVIVGTSAGAIIGAAYASGMTVDEIEQSLRPLGTATLFHDVARDDLPMRRKADDTLNFVGPEIGLSLNGVRLPKGAVAGVAMEAVLRNLTARQTDPDFDRLPVPFRAVATDLATVDMVVLERGSLATALRASMSLPAVVNPVEIDGRLLVDGGLARNLPVDVARALGAQVVIAVNIGTPLRTREELDSVLQVSEQMVRALTSRNVRQSLSELGPRDVLITPELGALGTADFDRMLDAAEAGERAAMAAAERLAPYRSDAAAWATWAAGRRATDNEQVVQRRVDELTITGTEHVNPAAVRAALHTQPGEAFDAAKTDADLKRLYAGGDFEHVGYNLAPLAQGGHALTVNVTEKAWGPNFLRVGFNLSSNFRGDAHYGLLLSHRRTWLNSLGAEWRNDLELGHVDRLRSEWYQPLDAGQRLFMAAHAESRREPFELYVFEQRIGRYRRRATALGLDLGVTLARATEWRIGLSRGHSTLGTDTGLIPGEVLAPRVAVAGWSSRLRVDTLDNLRFPRQGALLDLRYFSAEPGLGAAQRYAKLDLRLQTAASRGAHTLRGAAFINRPVSGDGLPLHELVQLGGFLRLSGYRDGEFLGVGAQLTRLVYTYRVAAPGLLDGVYVGLSAEAGRISDALAQLSPRSTLRSNAIFLAVDTPVGPLYLAHGRASSARSATYLFLGLP